MRVRGLMTESIATSTHPSAPNPVARAISEPNSAIPQSSIASGEAVSNSSQITLRSSVASCENSFVNDGPTKVITVLSSESHNNGGPQILLVQAFESLLKPFQALAQTNNL